MQIYASGSAGDSPPGHLQDDNDFALVSQNELATAKADKL